MPRKITLRIVGDTATKSQRRAGIVGEGNATSLVCSFDGGWDGYEKSLTFWDAEYANPVKILLTEAVRTAEREYTVLIPAEPLAKAGNCYLTIDGAAENKRARTVAVEFEVEDAPVADDASLPGTLVPTQAEQLSAAITVADNKAEEAKQIAEEAKDLAENGTGGTPDAVQYVPQELTEEQKAQARGNIGAADDAFFDRVETPPINRLNEETVSLGYALNGGTGELYSNASFGTTDYIPVTEGEYITFQTGALNVEKTQTVADFAYICGYDASKTFVSGSYKAWAKGYTVPANVVYVRFSSAHFVSYRAEQVHRMVVLGDTLQTFVPYEVVVEHILKAEHNNDKHIRAVSTSRTNGFTAEVDASWTSDVDNHDMCGYRMVYKGDIPNGLTGSISIGKGHNAYMGGYVKVGATNVYYYMGTDTTPLLSEAHGLTLTDYVTVELTIGYTTKATIRIATNGGEYSKSNLAWDVRKGAFFVTDSGSEAINGKFSYYCAGWETPTHLYGDSYFTVAYADRWPCYLLRDGHSKVLLNGYPGRASAGALTALKDTLAYARRPERIIWCMGMNDGDDNGTVDATWISCVQELSAICDREGIELILATIPNVPTVDNKAKNEYVKNSGRRYIDFAAAVGASTDTTWYSNMLSNDGVHPDVQGAIALYNQAITDVPELMR